jgi:signal peptidase I
MTKKFEDIISEQGKLVYTNVGDSMYPFIKPRDLLVIEKINSPLKKYDVPLYKRDTGQYVLHRIVKIKNGEYYICGDNRAYLERGIEDRHIIGLLTEIVRDGKTISVYSSKYRFYTSLLPFRRFIIRLKNKNKALKKKIKRKK